MKYKQCILLQDLSLFSKIILCRCTIFLWKIVIFPNKYESMISIVYCFKTLSWGMHPCSTYWNGKIWLCQHFSTWYYADHLNIKASASFTPNISSSTYEEVSKWYSNQIVPRNYHQEIFIGLQYEVEKLSTNGCITEFWKFMSRYNAHICIGYCTLSLLCEDNYYIMQSFVNIGYSNSSLLTLNYWKILLKAVSLSGM